MKNSSARWLSARPRTSTVTLSFTGSPPSKGSNGCVRRQLSFTNSRAKQILPFGTDKDNETSNGSLTTEEHAAWRKHNLQTLAESSALSFEEKLAILEDLEGLTIAMGYERDGDTGRLRRSIS